MKKITSDVLEAMSLRRRAGATYKEIEDELGVSHWACINYLRDIEVEESAVDKAWKEAEKAAASFLVEKGFVDIHDLNAFSPCGYWDILARKDDIWWLIDVTVSSTKTISGKIPKMVDGYRHAILFRDLTKQTWSLIKVTYEEV